MEILSVQNMATVVALLLALYTLIRVEPLKRSAASNSLTQQVINGLEHDLKGVLERNAQKDIEIKSLTKIYQDQAVKMDNLEREFSFFKKALTSHATCKYVTDYKCSCAIMDEINKFDNGEKDKH